jgi:hypothetical protein
MTEPLCTEKGARDNLSSPIADHDPSLDCRRGLPLAPERQVSGILSAQIRDQRTGRICRGHNRGSRRAGRIDPYGMVDKRPAESAAMNPETLIAIALVVALVVTFTAILGFTLR